jgi:hypothetical protein
VIEVLHETEVRAAAMAFVESKGGTTRDLEGLLSAAVVSGAECVVVDLGAEVVDVPADLLVCLRRAARRMQDLGGTMMVIAREPQLRRLLDLTLLSSAFTVVASREDALRSWA